MVTSTAIYATDFMVTKVHKSPGLYFEKHQTLRIKNAEWRIATYLDYEGLLQALVVPDYSILCNNWKLIPADSNRTDELYHAYFYDDLSKEGQCQAILGTQYLLLKKVKIATIIDKIKFYTQNLRKDSPDDNRPQLKRGFAPFGIIGTLSKSLFGLMTAEDAELINDRIDRAKEDQRQLTKLESESLHVVDSKFKAIVGHLETQKETMYRLKNNLDIYLEGIKVLEFFYQMLAHARNIASTFELIQESAESLLNLLIDLYHGKINTDLISRDMINDILKDIRSLQGNLDLPKGDLDPVHLASYCKVDAIFYGNRIIITIHVPLVHRMAYEIFKIYPVLVPQNLNSNFTKAASINPEKNYIALSYDQKSYFLTEAETLRNCEQAELEVICSIVNPIEDTALTTSCEAKILLNQTRDLTTCNFNLKNHLKTQWTYLQQSKEWLFSAPKPENIKIMCGNKISNSVTIEEIGVLRLNPGCRAQLTSTTLFTENQIKFGQSYIYHSDLHLNITEQFPQITKFLPTSVNETPNFDTHFHDDESLLTIIQKMDRISSQDPNGSSNKYLIYSVLSSLASIIFIIIALKLFVIIKYLRKIFLFPNSPPQEEIDNLRIPCSTPQENVPLSEIISITQTAEIN